MEMNIDKKELVELCEEFGCSLRYNWFSCSSY